MFEEENIESGQEPAEHILAIQLAALGILTAWAFGGNCAWAPGMVAAIGFFSPILLLIHNSTTYRGRVFLKRRYLRYTLPVWALLALFACDYLQTLLTPVDQNGVELLGLTIGNAWLPGNAIGVNWVPGLALCGAYLAAFNLRVVPAARPVLRNIVQILSLNAVLLAVFGILGVLLRAKSIAFLAKAPADDFFSMFTSSTHWCYFALLWVGALLGLGVQTLDAKQPWRHLLLENIFPVGGVVILGVTIAYRGSPVQIFLLGALVCAGAVAALNRVRAQKGFPAWTAALFGVAALAALALGIAGTVAHSKETAFLFANRLGISNALDWPTRLQLWQDGLSMLWARPLWGWGPDAFGAIFAFYQNAQMGDAYYALSGSNLINFLTEQGILLTLLWVGAPLYFAFRARKEIAKSAFAPVPLLACAAVGLCAVFDYPFSAPSITVSWWILFFAALQWAHLEAKVGHARARPKPLLRRTQPVRRARMN